MNVQKQIYLDSAASTPIDPRISEAMMDAFGATGNPHVRHHEFGVCTAKMVETARTKVAAVVGALPEEVIFTSGATEANNLAILGIVQSLKDSGKTHVVAGAVEHSSVLEPLRSVSDYLLTFVKPKPCGMVEASAIDEAITDKTGLVCLQLVNNETGTVQPLEEVGELLRDRGILLHCDAAQALGKVSCDALGYIADFVALSAHKIHGPQGIGALIVNKRARAKLRPLLLGGGQEGKLRSGTISTALCVGFGKACEVLDNATERLWELRERFLDILRNEGVSVFGHRERRWQVPGIISLRFPGIDSESLVMGLPHLAFGTGSACSSRGDTPSHVISALAGEAAAREMIRLSITRMSTEAEVVRAAELVRDFVRDIRASRRAA
jgi:cysteine desulfurase